MTKEFDVSATLDVSISLKLSSEEEALYKIMVEDDEDELAYDDFRDTMEERLRREIAKKYNIDPFDVGILSIDFD